MGPALDELGAGHDRVHEPGTGRRQIVAPGPSGADLVLHQTGRGRKGHVRGDGRNDDQVDFFGIQLPVLEQSARRLGRHERSRLTIEKPPFDNAGALANPGIGSVDHFLQIEIGQDFVGQVPGHGRYDRIVSSLARRHSTSHPVNIRHRVVRSLQS